MVIQLGYQQVGEILCQFAGVGWAGFSLLDLVEKVDSLGDVGC